MFYTFTLFVFELNLINKKCNPSQRTEPAIAITINMMSLTMPQIVEQKITKSNNPKLIFSK